MPTTTRAYSISAPDIDAEKERCGGDLDKFEFARVLKIDDLELPDPGPGDVRMRILAASAEHNVDHAILADTVNIVEARGGKMYPGNSAMGEVLEVGSDVTRFKPGDIVITHCNGEPDEFGFPLRIWGYDQPDSRGWYGKEAVLGEWQLIQAPIDCGLSLWEIAALPLRAPTAYHMWRRALGIIRIKASEEQLPALNVLGFGGGVSELFLMQAKANGHNAFFCSGSPGRRKKLEEQGIVPIDQKAFNRFVGKGDVKAFSKEVKHLTDGVGMHIICDMLRGPVWPAGFAAMARMGVNISAGWQLSQHIDYNTTIASVKQLTLDHTHYETVPFCEEATKLYGSVYKPAIHDEIYSFEDLPRCMVEMYENTQNGVPIVRIAEDLPDSVKGIV